MKLERELGLDIRWYAGTRLKPPASLKDIDFDSFRDNVRKFTCDDLVFQCAQLCWYAWEHDRVLKNPKHVLACRYAPKIAAAAGLFSPGKGRDPASEVECRILVGEYFNSDDIYGQETKIRDVLKDEIGRQAQKYELLKKIPVNDIGSVVASLLIVRTAQVQWEGYAYSRSDWVRALLIHEKFSQIFTAKTNLQLKGFERVFFGCEARKFFASAWLVFSLSNSDYSEHKTVRLIRCDGLNIPPEVCAHLDLSIDDVHGVVRHLGVRTDALRLARKKVEQLPLQDRSVSPALDTFSDRPIAILKDRDGIDTFILISPWKFLLKITESIGRDFLIYLSKQKDDGEPKLANVDIYSMRGDAYAAYHRELFASVPNLTCLDEVDWFKAGEKKGDWLWIGKEWAIVIETKVNMRPNVDRSFFHPGSLGAVWGALSKGLKQALCTFGSSGISPDLFKGKKRAVLLVANEAIPKQLSSFLDAAKKWDFLESEGDALGVLSSAELEIALFTSDADAIGEALKKDWDALKPFALGDKPPEVLDMLLDRRRAEELPHVKSAWDKIFPPPPATPKATNTT